MDPVISYPDLLWCKFVGMYRGPKNFGEAVLYLPLGFGVRLCFQKQALPSRIAMPNLVTLGQRALAYVWVIKIGTLRGVPTFWDYTTPVASKHWVRWGPAIWDGGCGWPVKLLHVIMPNLITVRQMARAIRRSPPPPKKKKNWVPRVPSSKFIQRSSNVTDRSCI